MRSSQILFSVGLMFLCMGQTGAQVAPSATDFRNVDLLFSFQGKGSSLFYDAGIVTVAYERLPMLRDQRVVIAGNSSGSIWSGYFANRGFNDESIAALKGLSKTADVSAIRQNENISYKLTKVLRQQETEMPPTVLMEAISIALDVKDISGCKSLEDVAARSNWKPNYPFVIVAANLDTIGTLGDEEGSSRLERMIEYDTYDMVWNDEAFATYERDPELFKNRNPLIAWNGSKKIGKAATYFCDPATFELMSKLPAEQRLGDLRLVSTPRDCALAIHASLAEPTYFAPVEEFDYDKLDVGNGVGRRGNCVRRLYYGGFIMPVVAQDIRRLLPECHALGTGWIGLPKLARMYFEKRWGLDVELMHHKSNWWLDAELRPPMNVQRQITARKLTTEQEFDLGREAALYAFAQGGKPPQYIMSTKYNWHPDNAVFREAPNSKQQPAATLRGIQDLLTK